MNILRTNPGNARNMRILGLDYGSKTVGVANEAAEKALEAVKKCEGLMDNTRVTALEEKMEKVLELLKNVVSTE